MSALPCAQPLLSDSEPLDLSLHQARRAYREWEEWAMSDDAARLAEHEVEAQIERRSREANRLLLQAHINRQGTGDVGPGILVHRPNGSTQTYRQDRVHPCKLISIFGEVKGQANGVSGPGAGLNPPAG